MITFKTKGNNHYIIVKLGGKPYSKVFKSRSSALYFAAGFWEGTKVNGN